MKRFLVNFVVLSMTWCCAFATHPMQSNAELILHELFKATGNYQISQPQIEIVDSEEKIASYSYRRNLILIEQKAIEVCQSFGKDSLNALAFIIGHELAHAYKGKDKGDVQHTSFLAYDRHFKASTRDEKLADIQGAFNAYLAGYETAGILSKLIDNLYESYDLKGKTLHGYPELEDRKNTSYEVETILDTLIQVFESANYLTVLGYYDIAEKYYEYILQYYMGKELLNNLGILKIHQAIEVGGKNIDPYLLPLELDFRSRLNKTRAEKLTYDELVKRKVLLKKALFYFDKVVRFDTSYFPAQLNKLCFMILNENYKEAINFYWSDRFQHFIKSNETPKTEKSKAQIAVAIAYAFLGDKDLSNLQKAEDYLLKMASKSNPQLSKMASYNLSILQNKPLNIPSEKTCKLKYSNSSFTKVDGVTPFKYVRSSGVYLDEGKEAMFYYEKLPNSTVLFTKWKGHPIVLQRVSSDNFKSKGNFQIGQSARYLIDQLHENSYSIIPAHRGFFVNCFPCGLIFKINEHNVIAEWAKVF